MDNDNIFHYEDFDILFSDLSLIETGGNYDRLKELFDKDFYGGEYWMVESHVTISHQNGAANLILHFFSDRRITIKEIQLSTSEVHYCPDIPILASWAQMEGWRMPEPSNDLVRDSEDFWKFFYDTSMIYSELLEKKYGKIEAVYDSEDFEEDDLEDDY